MWNMRDRNSRRRRDEQTPPPQPAADQLPTTRFATPADATLEPFSADALPPLADQLDEPMTAPTRKARTLTSSPSVTRAGHNTTGARRASGVESGVSRTAQQTQALVPLKTGEERDRALAAINAASDTTTTLIPGARRYRAPRAFVVPRRIGPRSAIIQFAVSMVATALLVSALTLSTPLGQAAALDVSGAGSANIGAEPWLPTRTPKPTAKPSFRPPAGANPGQQAVINNIVSVFGSYSQGALAVAKCESGYDPNAWNSYPILGSHASGVFQILYPSTWNTTSYASSSPFNADANIHAAYQIFKRDGYSWREWQCQP